MATLSPSTWVLVAIGVSYWFPAPGVHTHSHACAAQLPGWCSQNSRVHTFLPGRPSSPCGWRRQVNRSSFGREVLEAEGLQGLMTGHGGVAQPVGQSLGWSQHHSGPNRNIPVVPMVTAHLSGTHPQSQWHPQKTSWNYQGELG